MPRIQRRHIDRLKSSRSIRVYESERIHPVERQPKPQFSERRLVRERRQQDRPVAVDRRRQDRRNAYQKLRPEVRTLLENAGASNPSPGSRTGVYIDEDV